MGHELTSVGGFPTWYDLMPQGTDQGHWAYSASHALRDFFQQVEVRELWLPGFYCPDTVHFLSQFFSVHRYAADHPGQPGIPAMAQPGHGIVFYPPLGQTAGCRLPALAEMQARRLHSVLDLVHDLHAAPYWHAQGWNTVVSFRKFYPVPCGAQLLSAQLPPNAEQLCNANQAATELNAAWLALLQPRTAGYAQFKQHEAQVHQADAALPTWLPKLISCLNGAEFQARRQAAYGWLDQQLGHLNQFFDATGCARACAGAPIAYPFYRAGLDSPRLRQRLAAEGIFIPHFWPGMDHPEGPSAWHDCLLLPTGPLLSTPQLERLKAQLLPLIHSFTEDSP
ncbi:hypothetical protein PSQ39_18180 [Curvibacter sp. HBC28]|uniref:Uncharacterized protein n=1 Tax=Curvibacter microcysteis TaxID=3026419 RepID=A0ABT5MJ06_9BURK|nr:hypothetical protein [Curvibacter sp. HBC28]MDD0816573.1 hypothetical protein [Curvibacter sp. HBC28]